MSAWLVCRTLNDESGILNVFVWDSFKKAIQIAVSDFLHRELEGIYLTHILFIFIHESLEINN